VWFVEENPDKKEFDRKLRKIAKAKPKKET